MVLILPNNSSTLVWRVITAECHPITCHSMVPLYSRYFSKRSQQTPHSSPVSVRYGVSIVRLKFDLRSASHRSVICNIIIDWTVLWRHSTVYLQQLDHQIIISYDSHTLLRKSWLWMHRGEKVNQFKPLSYILNNIPRLKKVNFLVFSRGPFH